MFITIAHLIAREKKKEGKLFKPLSPIWFIIAVFVVFTLIIVVIVIVIVIAFLSYRHHRHFHLHHHVKPSQSQEGSI